MVQISLDLELTLCVCKPSSRPALARALAGSWIHPSPFTAVPVKGWGSPRGTCLLRARVSLLPSPPGAGERSQMEPAARAHGGSGFVSHPHTGCPLPREGVCDARGAATAGGFAPTGLGRQLGRRRRVSVGIFVVVPLCEKPQGTQTCSPLPTLSFWDDPKELCLPCPAGRPSAGVPWGLAGRRCHPLMSPILLQVQTRAFQQGSWSWKISAVHPDFGKPRRGDACLARLEKQGAASRGHVGARQSLTRLTDSLNTFLPSLSSAGAVLLGQGCSVTGAGPMAALTSGGASRNPLSPCTSSLGSQCSQTTSHEVCNGERNTCLQGRSAACCPDPSPSPSL